MSFLLSADCTFLGKSTYPRANNQIGTQVHLLSGVESAKVACEAQLYEAVSTIPEGSKVHVDLDFLATKKGNFLKAISISPLPAK
jgi:hypothetical protein